MSVENLWYAPVVGKALLASRPPASVLLLLVMLSPVRGRLAGKEDG